MTKSYYFSYDKDLDVLWAFSDSEIKGKLHKYSNNDDIWVRDDRGAITCLSVFRWQEHVKYEIDLFLALIAACLDMSIGSLIDRLKFLRLVDG
jgi:hypothetical protein